MQFSTAIRAQDFSPITTDPLRDRWTGGKLRHVVAALDGAPVAIVTDRQTGHAEIGVRLVGMRSGSMHSNENRVIVERILPNGDAQRTAFRVSSIGDTIIPLAELDTTGAKWRALDTWRRESMAATRAARARNAESGDVREWGAWTATPQLDDVSVSYEPHTGNPHYADVRGRFGHWRITLDELAETANA